MANAAAGHIRDACADSRPLTLKGRSVSIVCFESWHGCLCIKRTEPKSFVRLRYTTGSIALRAAGVWAGPTSIKTEIFVIRLRVVEDSSVK
jgi:hypothetical protein